MAAEHKVALRFEGVRFSYGSVPVLDEASFHIHEGEFVGLVGPNGTGKTTVLRLLLGLAEPDSGRIEVFGKAPKEVRDTIGYVPQHASYDPAFPISVKEVVRMGRLKSSSRRYTADDDRAVLTAMETADVRELSGRAYSALSGGQRRRVLVARALATEPRFLVLDEPTANMDGESEARLFRALGELKGKTTILVVTHDTGFVSALTDVVLCVGERAHPGGGRGIVRHRATPAENAPPEMFGGEALKVLHETAESGDACSCGGGENDR
ncbi:MAG: ABC transporter ATP-binding protein [Treponemataceae bacterium]